MFRVIKNPRRAGRGVWVFGWCWFQTRQRNPTMPSAIGAALQKKLGHQRKDTTQLPASAWAVAKEIVALKGWYQRVGTAGLELCGLVYVRIGFRDLLCIYRSDHRNNGHFIGKSFSTTLFIFHTYVRYQKLLYYVENYKLSSDLRWANTDIYEQVINTVIETKKRVSALCKLVSGQSSCSIVSTMR